LSPVGLKGGGKAPFLGDQSILVEISHRWPARWGQLQLHDELPCEREWNWQMCTGGHAKGGGPDLSCQRPPRILHAACKHEPVGRALIIHRTTQPRGCTCTCLRHMLAEHLEVKRQDAVGNECRNLARDSPGMNSCFCNATFLLHHCTDSTVCAPGTGGVAVARTMEEAPSGAWVGRPTPIPKRSVPRSS